MNNPPPLPPRARDYLDSPRRSSTPSRLPRSMLRSRAPGYILATLGVLAVGGFIAWKVVRQAEAIHTAETKTATTAAEPDTSPVRVLVDVPSASPAAEGVLISRLGTTGAVVAAPAATVTEPVGPAVPVMSLPKAKPATAPIAGDADPRPHPARATPAHHHAAHRHADPDRLAPSDRASGRDNNPDDVDKTPSPAPSAPADTSDLFDLRE